MTFNEEQEIHGLIININTMEDIIKTPRTPFKTLFNKPVNELRDLQETKLQEYNATFLK